MIRVELADEPESFDKLVRQPGLSALAEMVGEPPLIKRPGKRRKKVANQREEIPTKESPDFWTKAIPDLWEAYGGVCAYVSIYIEKVTGSPSVDHMIPKSTSWENAYEWSNYRLACSLMNSRKSNVPYVLDPFEIEDDWFDMELVGFQLRPSNAAEDDIKARVRATIEQLDLNDRECCEIRGEYAEDYWNREITWKRLQRRAPFVARQLKKQGRLLEGDAA